jgi:hypothetical protein
LSHTLIITRNMLMYGSGPPFAKTTKGRPPQS